MKAPTCDEECQPLKNETQDTRHRRQKTRGNGEQEFKKVSSPVFYHSLGGCCDDVGIGSMLI